MVRRRLFRLGAVLVVAMATCGSARAGAIHLTGDVAKDFPYSQQGVQVIVDNPNPIPAGLSMPPTSNPSDVAQADFMSSRGWTSGWNIQDVRLNYDQSTDTMYVGVNFFGIAGDADGNGDPGTSDPLTTASGGADIPHLGGRESIAVALDTNGDRKFDIIAGVPADKSTAGSGIDGFTVANYRDSNQGMAFNFGQALTGHMGNLAFDPSKDHPDFEFTISHFSTLPGFVSGNGFGIKVFAGTPDDVVSGEDTLPYTNVSPETIYGPEPATLVAWSLVLAAGAAWRLRRGSSRRLTRES